MKRPNITPGPWYAMPMHQTEETIIFADNEEPQVAVVRWKCGVEDNRELANIKALAAVPALLEALEAALPGLESDLLYCERHPQLDGLNQEACLAHKRARIAKARSALIAAGYQF